MYKPPFSIFSLLNTLDVVFLNKDVTNEEITMALFDMAPLKAPGSDGFHAFFFQNQWDVVGNVIYEWVKGIFVVSLE
ncbi:hypothetical protein J1N35_014722 [Gossypium stocksii]|uniref:Reverse transcriptase domain-containing protein n=1 Tax=Gossypium stocksii TaxID=47602 RepID=A0A9D3VX24_9ROSI|nr:hypothetical protein J1N35_014722 [Gossypium stocksii]